MSHPSKSNQEIGSEGEGQAADYLEQRGFQIMERNFRKKEGEIDLIASKKGDLHFIEVKTRSNENYGEPIDAITPHKKNRMLKVAQNYLMNHPEFDAYGRLFSVMSVESENESIEFFENAFEIPEQAL